MSTVSKHHCGCGSDCCGTEKAHEEKCSCHGHVHHSGGHHHGEVGHDHHVHAHTSACGCCDKPEVDERILLLRIAIAAVAFLVALVVPMKEWLKVCIFAVSVLAAGYDIAWHAVKTLVAEFSLDENLLMTVAAVGAFAIGECGEGAAVMLLFRIGEYLQDKAVERSRGSIAKLMDICPDTVKIVRNADVVTVAAEKARIGDIMLVSPGERVALDGIVETGISALDTSALTGESVPHDIAPGESIMSGCVNMTDVLTVKVTSEFKDSTVSRILKLVEDAENYRAKPEKMITRFAKKYTPAVIIMAVIIGIFVPLFGGLSFSEWVHRALVFLVISCPCALVISVPLTYFAGIGGGSRKGILFKGADVLDTMANATAVVFDKTGTLTNGSFKVTHVVPNGMTETQLLQLAAYAEAYSTHPMARSIVEASGVFPSSDNIVNYHEQRGMGVVAELKGNMVIAAGSAAMMDKLDIIIDEVELPGSVVHVAAAGRYAGYIVLGDTVKQDSADAVAMLKDAGISRVAIFTGDKKEAAAAVADSVGITEIHAECLPEEKTQRLLEIREGHNDGGSLVFVGDGINDAPVIAMADVGVAMGGIGSDAAIEAANVVIMTDEPSKVAEAVLTARTTKRIVRQNIVFALGVKLLIMILGVAGIAPMWLAVFADVGVALLAILNAMRAYGFGGENPKENA